MVTSAPSSTRAQATRGQILCMMVKELPESTDDRMVVYSLVTGEVDVWDRNGRSEYFELNKG